MNLKSVSSSRMNAVGWEDNTMYIRFKDSGVYAYENVSESEYINFINSPSLGSALCRFDKLHSYHRV